MTVRSLGFVAASALALGLVGGAQLQSWRLGTQIADLRAEHADTLRKQAEINAAAMAEQQAARLALEEKQQANDQKHQEELSNVQAENKSLRVALRNGTERMSARTVSKSCSSGGVPTADSTGGLDDAAGTAQLHPEVAADLADLAGDADSCAVTLTALQDWVKTVMTSH